MSTLVAYLFRAIHRRALLIEKFYFIRSRTLNAMLLHLILWAIFSMKLNTFMAEALDCLQSGAISIIVTELSWILNCFFINQSIKAGRRPRPKLCCISLYFWCFWQPKSQTWVTSYCSRLSTLMTIVASSGFHFHGFLSQNSSLLIRPSTLIQAWKIFTSKSLHFQNRFSPFRRLFFYGFTKSFFLIHFNLPINNVW